MAPRAGPQANESATRGRAAPAALTVRARSAVASAGAGTPASITRRAYAVTPASRLAPGREESAFADRPEDMNRNTVLLLALIVLLVLLASFVGVEDAAAEMKRGIDPGGDL